MTQIQGYFQGNAPDNNIAHIPTGQKYIPENLYPHSHKTWFYARFYGYEDTNFQGYISDQ